METWRLPGTGGGNTSLPTIVQVLFQVVSVKVAMPSGAAKFEPVMLVPGGISLQPIPFRAVNLMSTVVSAGPVTDFCGYNSNRIRLTTPPIGMVPIA